MRLRITVQIKHPPAVRDAPVEAACLQAYEDALLQLPNWVHTSWLAKLGLDGLAGHADGTISRDVHLTPSPAMACLAHLPAALGMGIAPAFAFDDPANRLAALPSHQLCRVLRARALLRRRVALRRCVDGRLRSQLKQWLHPVVFETVLRESPDNLDLDVQGLPILAGSGEDRPADMLAWEGFCLFERDGCWTDGALAHLVRLGFAEDMTPPVELERLPGAPDGSAWIMNRLDRFVPEAPWLCG